jgi:hypothetical protein
MSRASLKVLGSGLLALLLLPAPALAAGASNEELDEVLVNGVRIKPTRDPQQIVNWLKLLVGQFRYTGYVDLRAPGLPVQLLPVQGVTDCNPFGRAPGVHCEMKVAWAEVKGPDGEELPGGHSTLLPAMVEYGLDTDRLGIRFLQVDNEGTADFGSAYLVQGTLTTTTPCPNLSGECRRISRITPTVDGKRVEMLIDIERNYRRVVRYRFMLQRVGEVPEGAISGSAQ